MASLLRQQMKKELRRLDASDRDRAIRKALEAKRHRMGPESWDPLWRPCPWWSARDDAAHAAWLAAPPPAPVPWEETDAHRMWCAGDPVVFTTDGREHLAFVRISHGNIVPRWVKPGLEWRIHPVELTLRDPRTTWSDPWELSLAIAMLCGVAGDERCAWLTGPYDPIEEPELEALYDLAREELDRRAVPPTPTTGPAPTPEPKPRRGWTRAEIEALRQPEGVVEPVDLAPGR